MTKSPNLGYTWDAKDILKNTPYKVIGLLLWEKKDNNPIGAVIFAVSRLFNLKPNKTVEVVATPAAVTSVAASSDAPAPADAV